MIGLSATFVMSGSCTLQGHFVLLKHASVSLPFLRLSPFQTFLQQDGPSPLYLKDAGVLADLLVGFLPFERRNSSWSAEVFCVRFPSLP